MEKNAKSFELHVALLMQTKNLKLADARFQAWLQGPEGLEALLPKPAPVAVVSALKGV